MEEDIIEDIFHSKIFESREFKTRFFNRAPAEPRPSAGLGELKDNGKNPRHRACSSINLRKVRAGSFLR